MKKAYVLEINQLQKRYGKFQAVKDITLKIERGEIFALLGHNGAGKSTLMKMILGLATPSSGNIIIEGLTHQEKNREVKRKIGYLPERMNFYDNLTAWETITFYAKLKGLPLERCSFVLEQVGLTEARHRRVGTFSKGMQQRLGLAQAIIHKPDLLVLDEPTTGLDPKGILELKGMIRQWNQGGATIFFSSHNLGDVEELAHRVAVMNEGEIIAQGTLEELKKALQLQARLTVYLGTVHPNLWQRLAMKGIGPFEVKEDSISTYCPAAKKAKVLEAIMAEGVKIIDFKVEEPGLDLIYQKLIEKVDETGGRAGNYPITRHKSVVTHP
ncbi:MAG: ABC transporter ATP-binding protein [Bacillota bacterium]